MRIANFWSLKWNRTQERSYSEPEDPGKEKKDYIEPEGPYTDKPLAD